MMYSAFLFTASDSSFLPSRRCNEVVRGEYVQNFDDVLKSSIMMSGAQLDVLCTAILCTPFILFTPFVNKLRVS